MICSIDTVVVHTRVEFDFIGSGDGVMGRLIVTHTLYTCRLDETLGFSGVFLCVRFGRKLIGF